MKPALSLLVLLALPACNASPACRCTGTLPEGAISADCGYAQCVGGVLYRCTGRNVAVREADTCEPTPPPATNPRPAGTPDFFFFAVSGHIFTFEPYNYDYLSHYGTLDELESPMRSRGFSVEEFVASDNLYDRAGVWPEAPTEHGFLSLLSYMDYVRDTYVADWDNPTRIVVVGHSHGAVWAHIALHVLEQEGNPLPVDILIDLDSVTAGWTGKAIPGTGFGDAWGGYIDDYSASTGSSWPFDIASTHGSLVPGVAIDDLVPNSVIANIEVRSSDAVLYDPENNRRLDGSESAIFRYWSAENHGTVDNWDSTTIGVVQQAVADAYWP